jgi:DNA-binding transcriptional LysR family regulator
MPAAQADRADHLGFYDNRESAAEHGEARRVGNAVQERRIVLDEVAYCSTAHFDMPLSLGAASLATIMQMVANGYGVTLVPQVAVDAEVRDERVKLPRFAAPEPSRTIGLAWRRTSPRKADFVALGQLAVDAFARRANPPRSAKAEENSRAV